MVHYQETSQLVKVYINVKSPSSKQGNDSSSNLVGVFNPFEKY